MTLASFKSFVKKNQGKLYVRVESSFDGMVDCVMPVEDEFSEQRISSLSQPDHTFGISGVWIVRQGRDYFKKYENEEFTGIEVSNCCGRFVIAIKK